MSFRASQGRRIDWLDTRIESRFSNFLFIDRFYRSHPVLRRIFSLARKHGYRSLLIEEISQEGCALLVEENVALRLRRPNHQGSTVHRLSFWRCPPDQPARPQDFIGYAVFKSDSFAGRHLPEDHVYESVIPPERLESQNNFIHFRRPYTVRTLAGEQAVAGVLYAQQNIPTPPGLDRGGPKVPVSAGRRL